MNNTTHTIFPATQEALWAFWVLDLTDDAAEPDAATLRAIELAFEDLSTPEAIEAVLVVTD